MEPEEQKEFIEDMDRELDRLIALVNDLLERPGFRRGTAA